MGENLTNEIPAIIEGLCQSTLAMVKNDFLSLPEFREGFFSLTMNIVKHGTTGLFNLQPQTFQEMVQVIIFAMEHEKPDQMDLGLQSMHALLCIVKQNSQISNSFYESFCTMILQETLKLVTDYRHVSGFKLHCMILMEILQAVENDQIISFSTRILDENG